MLVSLSRESWHSKYYKFVKGYYPTYEFKSLCPYFWTIVTLILLSPVIVLWKSINKLTVKPISKAIDYSITKSLSKPYKEPSKFSKWYDKNGKSIGKWMGRIYIGSMLSLLTLMLIGSLIQLFQEKGAWLGIIYIFAWIGILTTSILAIWGIISFFETDTWRMVKGMSYSIKNKVCPMIIWEDKRK